MTDPPTTAQETLRDDILAGGRDDWVSTASIQGRISRGHLAQSASERHQLILQTVRLLLADGLVEVGDIPTPSDSGFLVWPGTIDEVMKRLGERVVDQYTEPDSWEYSTWLNLTPEGERLSAEIVLRRSDSR